MLKMFLCESHMIFLSKLREHSVANVVHKVTSNWEVIFFLFAGFAFNAIMFQVQTLFYDDSLASFSGILYQRHCLSLARNKWF